MTWGGTLRIALDDEPYMRHARRKMAELAGTSLPVEEFYQLVEERYEPYRKWALGENRESGDQELWCKWLLPDYDPERIARCAMSCPSSTGSPRAAGWWWTAGPRCWRSCTAGATSWALSPT